MRRTTPRCARVAADQEKLVDALRALPAADVVRSLEGLVTAERARKIRAAIDARLGAVTVLMDAPHDPHNGAAVLRSCDAFGIQRLHIIERKEAFLAARTVSRGSERWVEAKTYRCTADAVETLRASGHVLVATHPEGELGAADLATLPRFALVLGNERDGIHAELEAACAHRVRVPMRGFAESLNVSVTAAILLHHASEGRPGDLDEAERTFLIARALILTVQRSAEILAALGIYVPAEAIAAFTGDDDAR